MARIMLHGLIDNIQCSWVKLGPNSSPRCYGGVNDLGGTLMEETISRMAGSTNGSRKNDTSSKPWPPRRPTGPPAHHPLRPRHQHGRGSFMTAWSVVVPVKPWHLAKSRLKLPQSTRYEVARAMTLDTLEALTAASLVRSVLVVSADSEVRSVAVQLGARVVEDRPLASVDGLNFRSSSRPRVAREGATLGASRGRSH